MVPVIETVLIIDEPVLFVYVFVKLVLVTSVQSILVTVELTPLNGLIGNVIVVDELAGILNFNTNAIYYIFYY
jgi:hypothetical protein